MKECEKVSVQVLGISGLPAPQENARYIVNTLIRIACDGRTDLVSCGKLERDSEGRPMSHLSFYRNKVIE